MKWGEEYFAYKAAKDVIVPFELAEDYARLKCKLNLPPPASVRDATVNALTADQDEKRRMVLALLGHFNHGKTSLLDALINHSRSSSSVALTTSNAAQATGLPNGVAAVGGKVVGDVVSDLVSEEKYGITQVCTPIAWLLCILYIVVVTDHVHRKFEVATYLSHPNTN